MKIYCLMILFALIHVGYAATKTTKFTVNEVEVATEILSTIPAEEFLRNAPGGFEDMRLGDNQDWIILEPKQNPFVMAVHYAFAEHRPLVLSPDMIHLLINQMITREVLADPEKYRDIFTDSKEKKEVEADKEGVPWEKVFVDWEKGVLEKMPTKVVWEFSCKYSSSQPWERDARRLSFLKTVSPYYKFLAMQGCGIPYIELEGTPEDWKSLRSQLVHLQQFNMKKRHKALDTVLAEFVYASEGKPNQAFWQSIYKFQSRSGNTTVNGWINLFFIEENDPALDVALRQDFDWAEELESSGIDFFRSLFRKNMNKYPMGRVNMDFIWKIEIDEEQEIAFPMIVQSGFMGVSQNLETKQLRPEITWRIFHQTLSPELQSVVSELAPLEDLSYRTIRLIPRYFWYAYSESEDYEKMTKMDIVKQINLVLPYLYNLESVHFDVFDSDKSSIEELMKSCEILIKLKKLKTIYFSKKIPSECEEILKRNKDLEFTFRKPRK